MFVVISFVFIVSSSYFNTLNKYFLNFSGYFWFEIKNKHINIYSYGLVPSTIIQQVNLNFSSI